VTAFVTPATSFVAPITMKGHKDSIYLTQLIGEKMNQEFFKELENKLSEKFPIGIPRKEIGRATGNVLHPRTQANLDCLGEGIAGRFKIGRNTIYPVQNVIDFLQSKMTTAA
jgi:hypothetical protein